jgi:HD superfamily phosphohydrolase
MEIRDPVHGSIYYSDSETAILDTAEYQRLRAIKQLGFAEFSFPGATHNRYLHSVGVGHLVGQVFDNIFKMYAFSHPSVKERYRSTVRLAALLHDVGHGPLSHTTETVMPMLSELNVKIYAEQKNLGNALHESQNLNRRANHEDFTIKFVTESEISTAIKNNFSDITPAHVACLIDKSLRAPDDFFIDGGCDYRPIFSQLVSSELDVDRMDYLERDSYFCGTNYGKIDTHWLIQNMTIHRVQDKAYLALNRRALYSFDDFLISRHHMHLMVYCHHKSIIYEEMLNRYLTSKDCSFVLPASLDEYIKYNDYKLHEHLASAGNPWATRIAARKPFKVLMELHSTNESTRPEHIRATLEKEGFDVIWASSKNRLSKYHAVASEENSAQIYVVDQYDRHDVPAPIGQSTEIFKRYEGARIIDRVYVAPERHKEAEKLISDRRL